MIGFMVLQSVSMLVELVQLGRTSENETNLEIRLWRRPLAILERKHRPPVRLARGEKRTLVLLAVRLKAQTGQTIQPLGEVIRIVKPKTVFRWHREVLRRKWSDQQRNRGGGPRTDRESERLVVPLARANSWGGERIQGE